MVQGCLPQANKFSKVLVEVFGRKSGRVLEGRAREGIGTGAMLDSRCTRQALEAITHWPECQGMCVGSHLNR